MPHGGVAGHHVGYLHAGKIPPSDSAVAAGGAPENDPIALVMSQGPVEVMARHAIDQFPDEIDMAWRAGEEAADAADRARAQAAEGGRRIALECRPAKAGREHAASAAAA